MLWRSLPARSTTVPKMRSLVEWKVIIVTLLVTIVTLLVTKDALFTKMESIDGADFGEGSVSVIVSDAELSKTYSRGSVQDLNVANSNPRIFKTQSSVELREDSDEEKVVDEDPSYNSTEREDSIDILRALSPINATLSAHPVHHLSCFESIYNNCIQYIDELEF